ncbi:hypothetical protein ES708_20011 [subsurface metagenome]
MSIVANIHDAKTNLSKLIARTLDGEEVIIAKNGNPIVKLVPLRVPKKRKLGTFKGSITLSEDIDKPLPEQIVKEFYS